MSIQTDLQASPYFDDAETAHAKDYYKLLFRPGAAVQVRELNQLQSVLQDQISKFGDHVVNRGSLIEGCDATFYYNVPYIKIKDTTNTGAAVDINRYLGLLTVNPSTNLVARIIKTETGFESQDPNLNTLYLNYINSGDDGTVTQYSNGNLVTVYNEDLRLYSIDVANGSQGFLNTDSVVILSAIEVQNTAGGTEFSNGAFQVGETITQATSGAQAEITAVDTTSNTEAVVLRLKPLTSQLIIANNNSWSFNRNFNVVGGTTTNEAVLMDFVGGGAVASVNTSSVGVINNINLQAAGIGYYVDPFVTISTTQASTDQVNALDLIPNAFLTKVTVATNEFTDPVGFGYAMEISEGIVYQKGYFLNVQPQWKLVEKYANTPSNVSAGFTTVEYIANSSVDNSLYDNAAGFLNENAPGAHRLSLTPVLTVKTDTEAEEDPEYYPVWKFSAGKVTQTRDRSELAAVGDIMAERTFEESGNYFLDLFNVTSTSPTSIVDSENVFNYVIDPGQAYVAGYRIKTDRNTTLEIAKSKETVAYTNAAIDFTYGNYVRVNDYAGHLSFVEGAQVDLKSAEQNGLSAAPGTIPNNGSTLGKARIRSVVWERGGDAGSPGAVFRVYLFDIKMNAGKSFDKVRSFRTSTACGDLIREAKPGSGGGTLVAKLYGVANNALMYNTQLPLITTTNITYKYKTEETGITVDNLSQFSIAADAAAAWPYTGALSTAEKREVIITPETELIISDAISGTYTSDSSGTLTGSTTTFTTELSDGDYIKLTDSGSNTAIIRVNSIVTNTSLEFQPTAALSDINTGATFERVFPANVPIEFATRSGRTATVNGNNLDVNLNENLTSGVGTASIIFNQKTTLSNPTSKTVNRKVYVKIDVATNSAGTSGPWCLGLPDIFRLRAVYDGATTSDTDITNFFYVNSNQKTNYLDVGFLNLKSIPRYTVGGSDVFLVELDCFTTASEGLKTIGSYSLDDSKTLGELTTDGTVINTLEIPEMTGPEGNYYDLREALDFRPITSATTTYQTDPALAPTNPSLVVESTRFAATDKKFPIPEGDITLSYTYYDSRDDSIVLNTDGSFDVLEGEKLREARQEDEFLLYTAEVPPYPSLPEKLSENMSEIMSVNVYDETIQTGRLERYTITTEASAMQTPGYTMDEIRSLENRIAAIEYYVSLSDNETKVKNKVLSSSVDPTLERYKFGFFSDEFVDASLTNVDDPAQNSSIYDYRMRPSKNPIEVSFRPAVISGPNSDGKKIKLKYDVVNLVSQNNSTDGPVIVVPPPPAPIPPTRERPVPPPVIPPPPVVIEEVETKCVAIKNKNNLSSKSKDALDTSLIKDSYTFTLSSNTVADGQQCTIFFDMYSGADRFVVKQGTTTLFTSSTKTFRTLTAAEKREQPGGKNSIRWYGKTATSAGNAVYDNNFYVKDVGAYDFTYNQSAGNKITIEVLKGVGSNWRYVFCYPAPKLAVDPVYRSTPINVPPATNPGPINIPVPTVPPPAAPLPPTPVPSPPSVQPSTAITVNGETITLPETTLINVGSEGFFTGSIPIPTRIPLQIPAVVVAPPVIRKQPPKVQPARPPRRPIKTPSTRRILHTADGFTRIPGRDHIDSFRVSGMARTSTAKIVVPPLPPVPNLPPPPPPEPPAPPKKVRKVPRKIPVKNTVRSVDLSRGIVPPALSQVTKKISGGQPKAPSTTSKVDVTKNIAVRGIKIGKINIGSIGGL